MLIEYQVNDKYAKTADSKDKSCSAELLFMALFEQQK
jgi:hypothetical protein